VRAKPSTASHADNNKLVLRGTLCPCEAYGMRWKCRERNEIAQWRRLTVATHPAANDAHTLPTGPAGSRLGGCRTAAVGNNGACRRLARYAPALSSTAAIHRAWRQGAPQAKEKETTRGGDLVCMTSASDAHEHTHNPSPQPYLALWDTQSSWEAYGMRNKRRKENNGGHKSRNNGYHTNEKEWAVQVSMQGVCGTHMLPTPQPPTQAQTRHNPHGRWTPAQGWEQRRHMRSGPVGQG
jgi:hypothetical protein